MKNDRSIDSSQLTDVLIEFGLKHAYKVGPVPWRLRMRMWWMRLMGACPHCYGSGKTGDVDALVCQCVYYRTDRSR